MSSGLTWSFRRSASHDRIIFHSNQRAWELCQMRFFSTSRNRSHDDHSAFMLRLAGVGVQRASNPQMRTLLYCTFAVHPQHPITSLEDYSRQSYSPQNNDIVRRLCRGTVPHGIHDKTQPCGLYEEARTIDVHSSRSFDSITMSDAQAVVNAQ